MSNNGINIVHNPTEQRFEAEIEGQIAELNYTIGGNTIIFTHTGVPSALEGRGIGSLLVKAGLDHARENNLKVKALCWFVSGYIQRHEEYQDVVG